MILELCHGTEYSARRLDVLQPPAPEVPDERFEHETRFPGTAGNVSNNVSLTSLTEVLRMKRCLQGQADPSNSEPVELLSGLAWKIRITETIPFGLATPCSAWTSARNQRGYAGIRVGWRVAQVRRVVPERQGVALGRRRTQSASAATPFASTRAIVWSARKRRPATSEGSDASPPRISSSPRWPSPTARPRRGGSRAWWAGQSACSCRACRGLRFRRRAIAGFI